MRPARQGMHRSRVGDRFGLDSDLMTMSAVPQLPAAQFIAGTSSWARSGHWNDPDGSSSSTTTEYSEYLTRFRRHSHLLLRGIM